MRHSVERNAGAEITLPDGPRYARENVRHRGHRGVDVTRVLVIASSLMRHCLHLLLDRLPGISCVAVADTTTQPDVLLIAPAMTGREFLVLPSRIPALSNSQGNPAVLLVPEGCTMPELMEWNDQCIRMGITPVATVSWEEGADPLAHALITAAAKTTGSKESPRGGAAHALAGHKGGVTVSEESHEDVEPLTPQEEAVARLAATGLTNTEIAERLGVTVNTIKTQLRLVYQKLSVHRRAQLATLLASETCSSSSPKRVMTPDDFHSKI